MVISSELLHSNHSLRPRPNSHREQAPHFRTLMCYPIWLELIAYEPYITLPYGPFDMKNRLSRSVACPRGFHPIHECLKYVYTKFLFSEAFKFVDIPFTNKYEWNTMVDYSPVDRMIYAWDRGHQITYNLTIELQN